jgi:hypothetical protein
MFGLFHAGRTILFASNVPIVLALSNALAAVATYEHGPFGAGRFELVIRGVGPVMNA